MTDADDIESQFPDAFTRAIGTLTRNFHTTDGIIQDVDPVAFTCTVSIGDTNDLSDPPVLKYDVPLRVLIGAQASVVEIPTVGTNCTICFRDGKDGRPQLVGVHQSDKLLVNLPAVIFNGGKLGGLINVEDLVTRLNILENDINTLKTAFAAWVVAPSDGGAALKAITAEWYGEQLEDTTRDQIEDTKITH